MNQHGADFFFTQTDVVFLDVANEVVQLSDDFDTRESAAADDKGEQLTPEAGILFDIRLFEHVNDVIAERHGVGQRAKRQRVFEHAGHTVEVRNFSQRDDQV